MSGKGKLTSVGIRTRPGTAVGQVERRPLRRGNLCRWLVSPLKTVCLAASILAMLIGTSGRTQADIVAYYRFEEGSGTDVIDSVSGTVQGTHCATYSTDVPVSPIPQTGQDDIYSLQYDKTPLSFALITDQPFMLHCPGDATVEWWMKVPDQPHASIFWTRGNSADTNRFNIHINPGGNFGYDYRAPDGNLHTIVPQFGSVFVAVDTWTHMAIVRTGDTYSLYIDGNLADMTTDLNPNLPDSTSWTISGRSCCQMAGFVDEVRFANVALSPSQFLNASPP